jgi:hypothetical protein
MTSGVAERLLMIGLSSCAAKVKMWFCTDQLQRKRRGACNAKSCLFATEVKKDGAYWWMGVGFQVDQTIHRLIGSPQQCLGVHGTWGRYTSYIGGAKIKKWKIKPTNTKETKNGN